MTTLIAPPDAADSAIEARNGCTLRISRRGEADRTYSLTSGKCTIGSSPRCHICLPAADARPLQCLVALETSAAVVTRWAAGVLLNGREFATAPLGAGDRLSIGPWKIDVQSITPLASPAPPTVRETQDFVPPAPAEPEAELPVDLAPAIELAPTAWEQAPDLPEPCEAPQPAPLPRPARASAQTIHMGDESAPLLLAAPRRLDCSPSQAFADRLLLNLWTANHLARNRCQALLAALRDARRLFEQSAAAWSASEAARLTKEAEWSAKEIEWSAKEVAWSKKDAEWSAREAELTQVGAACEAQANQWKVKHVSFESELSALQRDLAEANSQRDRLAAELAALTDHKAQDAADETQNKSLFEAQAVLEQELTDLRRQLAERDDLLTQRENQFQTLTAERSSAVAALHVLDNQLRLEQDRYEALVARGERHESVPDAARHASPRDREPVRELVEIQPPAVQPLLHRHQDEPAPDLWPSVTPDEPAAEAPSPWVPFAPPAEESIGALIDAPPEPVDSPADLRSDWHEVPASPPALSNDAPPIVAEEPKPEFVPASFIDRYRNLLDDEASDAGFESDVRRSLLDDEYLSPAQAQAHDDPVEESDEALDAYMSNLMRRVRGDSPPPGPTPAAKSRSKPLAAGLLASDADSFESAPEPEAPAEPFQLESIKRPARKPFNLDLTALREIANVTARTAIAEHRQRRHVESIISKVIISAMGVAAGAYALLAAPSFDSPWFWAGCLAATTSAGLAVQLCVVLRRRINRRRRHLDPQAANEYRDEPAQDPISDFTAEYAENAERTSTETTE